MLLKTSPQRENTIYQSPAQIWLVSLGGHKKRKKDREVDSAQRQQIEIRDQSPRCHGWPFLPTGNADWEGCRWRNEVVIYHTVINLRTQAVAGRPRLVPTARQRCRHPGAIRETADLSPSLLHPSLSGCSAAGLFKVRPGEICVLFVANA